MGLEAGGAPDIGEGYQPEEVIRKFVVGKDKRPECQAPHCQNTLANRRDGRAVGGLENRDGWFTGSREFDGVKDVSVRCSNEDMGRTRIRDGHNPRSTGRLKMVRQ
jgi:hypothetical protein